MKEAFTHLGLSYLNRPRLEQINKIIEEYFEEGYSLTLRQLYYQLVAKGMIENKKSEYQKLMNIVKKGRLAGVIDWDAIEDRLRIPYAPPWHENPEDALDSLFKEYCVNRQEGQETYLEVWCEKDALSSILYRVTAKYQIPLLIDRGYSSISAMYRAHERFVGRRVKIFYVGDFDPSGLDMLRDIMQRMMDFNLDPNTFKLEPIALTEEQIKEYEPPPNFAKIKDPRYEWYMKKHGTKSWEVDALPPKVLHSLLEDHIKESIDLELYQEQLKREEQDRKRLVQLIKHTNKDWVADKSKATLEGWVEAMTKETRTNASKIVETSESLEALAYRIYRAFVA